MLGLLARAFLIRHLLGGGSRRGGRTGFFGPFPYYSGEVEEMFAHMREVIDVDELRRLSVRVKAFKKVAPTRPHPTVPNEPRPRMAAGPAASLFDRMRDLATGHGS